MKKIIISLLIFFLFACQDKLENQIKIGAILELTGALGEYGNNAKNGMELAQNEINKISEKKLEIIFEDSKSDPKTAVSSFLKLVNLDRVKIITGFIASSSALSCAKLAKDNQVVLFSTGATTPLLSGANKYVLRNRLSGNKEAEAMASFVSSQLKQEVASLFYVNTDFGIGNSKAFENSFPGAISFKEFYEQGKKDFRTEIEKLKKDESKVTYLVGHIWEISNFIQQAKQLGLDKRIVVSGIIESQEFLDKTGEAAEGVVYVIQRFDRDVSDKSEKFYNSYNQKFQKKPDIFAALAYDAINILYEVLQKNNNLSPNQIVDSLKQREKFHGVMGNVSFDKNGDIQSDISIRTIKNSEFINYNLKN